jgi:AcrR family transcriptional regulator
MSATRTARERARAELTREIKDEARRQLAADGPHRLSLRSVARELGMVSSALYRYFPSRDDLLTALIVDAYNALGEAAEQVEAATDRRSRWLATCRAVRTWARAHPHEYALIYGSPIPGYRAPQDTIAPASRVPLILIALAREAWHAGTLTPASGGAVPRGALARQSEQLAASLATDLPSDVLVRIAIAWTQLFGMISFELFGQFVGGYDPTDHFFEYAADQLAEYVGVR